MKAMVYKRYGAPEVVHREEVAKPTPKAKQVLVRIHAATVTSADTKVRSLNVPTGFGVLLRLALGITAPRNPVLGLEFAGEVEAIGKDVTEFKVGDRVFGASAKMGCHATYVVVAENEAITKTPANLSDEEAAAVPFGALSSLVFLRDFAELKQGERLLVHGASGNLGVFALQLGKLFGARVTGVCGPNNVELVASLGAEKVVNYMREDFTATGESYDVVFETVGAATFTKCRKALAKNGRSIHPAAGLPDLFRMLWARLTGGKRGKGGVAIFKKKDLVIVKEMIEAGDIRPIVDRSYPLEQVAEAHRYVDSGRKKGSVVIQVSMEATSSPAH